MGIASGSPILAAFPAIRVCSFILAVSLTERFLSSKPLDQHDKARMTFHQGGHVTIVRATEQIALPMPGNGAVFNFCGPLPDGDRIHDLTTAVSTHTRMPRATDPPLGTQVLHQLFFQHSAGLNEQAAVNGFVRHAQVSVLGILSLQPSGNLFRRLVPNQFTRNDRA